MTLRILDVEQRSEAWHAARRGIVTASIVGKLLTVRKLGALDFDCPACGATEGNPCRGKRAPFEPIKTLHSERTPSADKKVTVIEPASNDDSRGLTWALADERVYGITDQTYVTQAMWRGIDEEPLARDLYAQHFSPVREVGFMIEDKWGFSLGYSPDGLVGDDGLIEIKSRSGKTHMQTVVAGTVPIANMAQLQCGLLVTGRAWCDYLDYSSGRHMYPIRVRPDERWQKAILAAVHRFEGNVAETVAQYLAAVEGLPVADITPNYDAPVELKLA